MLGSSRVPRLYCAILGIARCGVHGDLRWRSGVRAEKFEQERSQRGNQVQSEHGVEKNVRSCELVTDRTLRLAPTMARQADASEASGRPAQSSR